MWTIDVIILRLRGYLRIVGEEGSAPGATRSNCSVMTGCCRGSHLGMPSVLIRREGEGVCRLKSHRRWSSGMVIPEGGRCSACSGVGDCGVPCGTHNLKNRRQRSVEVMTMRQIISSRGDFGQASDAYLLLTYGMP
ncbi:hypothetical protein ACMZ5A_29400 [Bacillus mobilis]|uniref:hypothetical protein n=1 Tax=Bacillus mobilis TaxID=2026190 RepID=UPI0039F0B336